jgi:hypothetical protein
MSDYFGALIRSSALTIAGRAAAPAFGPSVPADIVEIHEERETTSGWATAAAPEIVVEPHADAASATLEPVTKPQTGPNAAVVPRCAGALESTPAPHLTAPAAAREQTTPRPAAATRLDHVDPVRVAMQWVASDPEARVEHARQPSHGPVVTAPPMAPPRGTDVVSEGRILVSDDAAALSIDASRPRPPTESATERAIVPAPVPAPRQSAPPSRPARNVSARTHDEHRDRDEIVEVSIGAINLHIDAPAPQTIVRSPSEGRAQPSLERRNARSGLARRYLRSI